MAVTTFENFYTLLKNNIVYFQYQKADAVLNIKGTLVRDLIPSSDEDLIKYDKSIKFSDFYLDQWVGTDSDRYNILMELENNGSTLTIPEWLKIYSINNEIWINIEINKILSLQVVDS